MPILKIEVPSYWYAPMTEKKCRFYKEVRKFLGGKKYNWGTGIKIRCVECMAAENTDQDESISDEARHAGRL